MAISGNLRISATLASYNPHPFRVSLPSSKVDFTCTNIGSNLNTITQKWPGFVINTQNTRGQSNSKLHSGVTGDFDLSPNSMAQEMESFMLNAINFSFMERLNLAWKIIFPSPTAKRSSNARTAKQRLKMILFSDRCAVSDEAKRKIVDNIVRSLSDFVEIESQEKVQLNVSTDSGLGTIYSVTVPVRRVKPEYQEVDEDGVITSIEYKDTEDDSVDVKFDFYVRE